MLKCKGFATTLKSEPIVFLKKVCASFIIPSRGTTNKKEVKKKLTINDRKILLLKTISESELGPFLNDAYSDRIKPFIRKTTDATVRYGFVVNSTVAKDIVEKISPELKDDSIIVEGNPGLGFITLNLIKYSKAKIYLFENSELQSFCLSQILKKYPDKLHLIPVNLFGKKGSFLKQTLNLFKLIKPNVDMKIIGVVPNFSFFAAFAFVILSQGLWKDIRFVEFYVAVGEDGFKKMPGKVRVGRFSTHCLFNFLFDAELITQYPRTAFLPLPKNEDDDNMFLYKLYRKRDISREISEDNLPFYVAFVLSFTGHRRKNVISILEQWMPSIRPYLIEKGIKNSTRVEDLSFSESIKLFNLVKDFDEQQSFQSLLMSFMNSVSKY